jgi:hypothetical protein
MEAQKLAKIDSMKRGELFAEAKSRGLIVMRNNTNAELKAMIINDIKKREQYRIHKDVSNLFEEYEN